MQAVHADVRQTLYFLCRDEADQLLADIDDMLADLTEHLDLMIPGSSAQSKSHH